MPFIGARVKAFIYYVQYGSLPFELHNPEPSITQYPNVSQFLPEIRTFLVMAPSYSRCLKASKSNVAEELSIILRLVKIYQ